MPAVEIGQLTTQVHLIAQQFGSPPELMAGLRDLFETYADRTYRPGATRSPASILPEYHLSPVIMRLLEMELGKYCDQNPLASLELIDLMWNEPFREYRLLAASLLGKIPLNHSNEVINRLQKWSHAVTEYSLAESIISSGSMKLRSQAPEEWLAIIKQWLKSKNDLEISLGLTSLIPLIKDRGFTGLPQVFDLLVQRLKKLNPSESSTLQKVIEELARRTPNETVYVLKEVIAVSSDQALFRLIRRSLDAFPDESQSSLRTALSLGTRSGS